MTNNPHPALSPARQTLFRASQINARAAAEDALRREQNRKRQQSRAAIPRRARIRFKGGPLDRKTSVVINPASHLNADGTEVVASRARDLITGHARLGSTARLYFLAPDKITYRWLPDWLAEQRTNQIRALLEEKAEHPERGEQIEQQIRQIEASAA